MDTAKAAQTPSGQTQSAGSRAAGNLPDIYRRLGKAELRQALKRMHLIRAFEEASEQAYMRGLIHGTMHLSIGQEASAVGACAPLAESDYITSTHRGHGHCIAKGADLGRMFAEFFGKREGYCRGRGGSMHMADVSKGNLGANAIVAGGIPIATGAALSIKKQGLDRVAMSFFGDGANNEGAFHESLNMAAIWKLPVVYLCENNQYGMSVAVSQATATQTIAERACAYDIPGVRVDGNDFKAIAGAAFEAVERARRGEGPTLIESVTYRWRGHSKSDRNRYRTTEEIEYWKTEMDPIRRFEGELSDLGLLDADAIEAIRAEVEQEIEAALDYARNGAEPEVENLTRYVYTTRDEAA